MHISFYITFQIYIKICLCL